MTTRISRLVSTLASALILLATGAFAIAADANAKLTVMTYNLRYASATPPNAWSARRPVAKECIRASGPDVIGTQEGVYQQIKDLATDLPEYDWIGTGRDGGSRGEFMAIFYRKDRFEPLEFDHFWLSDTPDVVGSATWGHQNRRMVTWVRFLDRNVDREFYFINTHLDHQVQPAREKAATLIRERIQSLKPNLPIVLVGDFNAAAGANKTYDILTEGDFLKDTWTTAGERKNEDISTFHNYRGPREGARIDWILTRGPVAADKIEIVTFSADGQYPSDHFPVIAWIRWTD